MRASILSRALHAFSLIEVTLALGLCSFAIVGVFGLLAVSMNSTRSSASDTTLAAMVGEVQADLRGRAFPDVENGLSAASLVYYFNGDGTRLPSRDATTVYECRIRGQADPDTAGTKNNLLRLRLEFSRQADGRSHVVSTLPTLLARHE